MRRDEGVGPGATPGAAGDAEVVEDLGVRAAAPSKRRPRGVRSGASRSGCWGGGGFVRAGLEEVVWTQLWGVGATLGNVKMIQAG